MKDKVSVFLIVFFSFLLTSTVLNVKPAYAVVPCGICNESTVKDCGDGYQLPPYTHSCHKPWESQDVCNSCCSPGIVDAPCTYVGGGGGAGEPPPPPPPTATPTPMPADLAVSSISLHDNGGSLRSSRAFSPLEPIYIRTVLTNQGAGYPDSASYHAVYKNSSSLGMTIWTSADWPPGTSYEYESWSGGTRDYRFSTPSFTQTTPGSYTLRVVADYQGNVTESDNANNERTLTYTILSPDLDVTGFRLADRNGVVKGSTTNPFFRGYDRIYPIVEITNIGDGRANSTDNGTDSQIFAHRPTRANVDEESPENVTMRNGEFGAGAVRRYEAFPGGENESVFNNSNFWVPDTSGTFTARIHVNYDQDAVESDYGNNQAIQTYTVVDPYRIRGRVFNDRDKSGVYNSSTDEYLSGFNVQAYDASNKLVATDTTDTNGYYSFYPLREGTYEVRLTLPSSYINTCPTIRSVTLGPDSLSNNFCVYGKYSISGNVFEDTDSDKVMDADESTFKASPGVAVMTEPNGAPTPVITNNSDGTYTVENLISGNYSLSYNTLPSGYFIVHPRNGPPPRFNIPVGTCTGGTPTPAGTCESGSYSQVNYAINKGEPWFQAYGLDVRFDQGISNPIPSYPENACLGSYMMVNTSSLTPGILFTGNIPSNLRLGQASKEPYNWLVGGPTYPEVFTPSSGTIKTSYTYMRSVVSQSNISTTDLSTICTLSTCTLPSDLASGVYVASGDVTLNSFTAAADRDIVILIDGNLTINGTLRVPTSSTVFYSVAGNIDVSPTVGSPASCPPPATGNGDIEGFFSTDKSFTAQTQASCELNTPDKQLNVQGAIVVNAAQNGGTFTNLRNLCTSNVTYPSFTIKERPDFILNAPEVMKVPNYIWQEDAP